MYHGEVNVAQESLNAFLSCAEELAVKGLTTDSKPFPASSSSKAAAAASSSDGAASGRVQDAPNLDDDLDFVPPPQRGKQGTTPSAKKTPSASRKREADLSLDPEEAKKIKPEPESLGGAEGGDDFAPDDSYGGADFDDSYGGGGYEDMDESGNMEGSELTKGDGGPRFNKSSPRIVQFKKLNVISDRRELDVPATFIANKVGDKKTGKYNVLVDPDDYEYLKDKTRGERTYWRCRMRQKLDCKAMACTMNDMLKFITHYHTHQAVYHEEKDILNPNVAAEREILEAATRVRPKTPEVVQAPMDPLDAALMAAAKSHERDLLAAAIRTRPATPPKPQPVPLPQQSQTSEEVVAVPSASFSNPAKPELKAGPGAGRNKAVKKDVLEAAVQSLKSPKTKKKQGGKNMPALN